MDKQESLAVVAILQDARDTIEEVVRATPSISAVAALRLQDAAGRLNKAIGTYKEKARDQSR
jgi:plasmid maintenance system antidote protein VapI